MAKSFTPRDYRNNKNTRGTIEHLWYKWYQKLWRSYALYHDHPRGEPPVDMRNEFARDVKFVVEKEVVKIAPEITELIDD